MAFSGVLERAASLGLAAMVALSCLSVLVDFRSRAQVVHQPVPLLPVEEVAFLSGTTLIDAVETLIAISSKLHAEDWQVSKSSCGSPAWNRSIQPKPLEIRRLITCNCSFGSGTICHVTNISVKGYNLTGILPPELGNLTQLNELDLTRNYISGPIPPSLAQLTNLAKLSLLGNRLSGTIPLEIGHITTLQELVLEDNLLQGPLPPSLGNLKSLEILILSANNFTGSIPDSFANLRNITSFRIDGSTLAGKLPEFIGNWTNLKELYLQGTSMQGPIPSTVSMLYNLTDLLGGPTSVFPNLKDLTKIRTLVLRNCLLNGSIPDYIGKAARLKTLDLSFNSLTGIIPDMGDLDDLQFMFLNNNSLTGQVPSWILSKNGNFDLSYNNYTGIPPQRDCLQVRVNLISSYSPVSNSAPWCFQKDLPCNENNIHNEVLYINCAGTETSFGNKTYEADQYVDGRSTFYPVTGKWGYSSTGVYMENEGADYVARDTSKHNKTADIYETARGAPQSLKYYGFCMRKGIYNVTLHFAEIKFSNDETFASLGRRIFDISIQGKIVRRDFDIVKKAGGVQIGTTEVFDNVIVNGTTLEIHLYWSGKGTTAIPKKGVYGPLISGISVTLKSRFPDASSGSIGGVTRENSGLSVGLIAGIVVSSFVVLLVLCFSIFMIWRRKDDRDPELRGLDLQTGCFTLRQIKLATNNFNSANKIGEGGFGPVYKGILSNVGVVAVKQLSAKSMQGNREFVNEIGMISALQHPNLVKLFGCCMEGNQLLLVYEYLENNSLARAIFGTEEQTLRLDWQTRKNILLGVAKGLTYLHEESRLKIVHRDIKATNVLLDKDLNAKISDFGLAKLHEEEESHISTRIAIFFLFGYLYRGYMAPEYATRGYLTDKADVYSFGIVILETVSGRSNTSYRLKGENVYLVDWAYMLKEQGDLLELVDPTLSSGSYLKEEVEKMLNLSLLCANPSHTLRPLMSSVVDMIEGKAPVQAPIIQQGGSEFASGQQSASFRALQKTTLQDSYNTNVSWESNDQVRQSISTDDVPLDSSSSIISKVDHANDDDDDDDHDDIVPLSSSGRHL